jgi:hypothetical protein
MKKFLIRLLPFLIFCIVLIFILPAILDPYNVFHYKDVRINGVEPNRNYIKTRYIIENPNKFDSYLFGSSRVGNIDTSLIDGFNCYNMFYSVGFILEHYYTLEAMTNRNIIPKLVMLGVDDISCFHNPSVHINDLMRKPLILPPLPHSFSDSLVYVKFLINYCNPPMVLSSLKETILYKKTVHATEDEKGFYISGSYPRINFEPPTGFAWKDAKPGTGYQENRIDENISDIKKIIDLCKRYNIKLIIFTNPLHVLTYQEAVKNGYLDFLYKLTEITEYYNFSGLNKITTNNAYFIETSHYKFEVGDMIVNTIFNNIFDEELLGQGFGYYVTKDNRDAFFKILNDQRESQNAF